MQGQKKSLAFKGFPWQEHARPPSLTVHNTPRTALRVGFAGFGRAYSFEKIYAPLRAPPACRFAPVLPLVCPCGAFLMLPVGGVPLGMSRALQGGCRVPRRRKGKPPTQPRARGMRESCHDKRTAAFQTIVSERNPDLTCIIACFNTGHSSISMLLTVLFSSYNKLTTVLKILDNGSAMGQNMVNPAVAGVSRHEKPLRKMGNTTARWQRQKAFSYQ